MLDIVRLIALPLLVFPMKQLVILITILVLGCLGSLYHPFWAVLLYYLLAVLRPQHLWDWALPVEWRWSLCSVLIVLMSLAANLPRIVSRLRVNAVGILTIMFGSWLMLSMLTAFNPQTSLTYGTDIGKILLMALIAGIVIDRLWQIRALTLMLLTTIGYIAWEVNSLYLLQGRLDIFHYGYGGLDNNGAALMLAMGIPFAYAYGTSAPRLWQRLASWTIGLLMLHAMLLAYSRGAMVAAGVGVIWLLVHHKPRINALMIVILLAVAVSFLAGQEIRQRFMSTQRYTTDSSSQARFLSWRAGWEIAWDHPITGIGIRNSNRYTQNYGAEKFQQTIHSQYLQIAADSGIPAILIFIALLGTSMYYLTRARRMCRDQLSGDHDDHPSLLPERAVISHARQLILSCQASLLIYAIGGVFLSLEMFELPWLLMVIAGVMPNALRNEFEQAANQPAPAKGPRLRGYYQQQIDRLRRTAPAIRNHGKGLAPQ